MEPITKTRKNNISKRQRTECFLAALPEFKKAAEKYKKVKVEYVNGK